MIKDLTKILLSIGFILESMFCCYTLKALIVLLPTSPSLTHSATYIHYAYASVVTASLFGWLVYKEVKKGAVEQ